MEVKTKKKLGLFFKSLVSIAGLLALFNPIQALAATEYISPSSGDFAVGSTFSVGVYTSSPDQPASAFAGYLSFPTDKLSVSSLSKNGSMISVWVQEPTYSNTNGTIGFEGFIPNPGYTGTGGLLLTITFQVKAAGTADVKFTNAAVLANDGYGTNITTGSGSASFKLGTSEEPPVETPPATPGVPAAPSINSSTHPNQNAWYANNDPSFVLGLAAGTTGVSVLVNQSPNTDPGTTSGGLSSNYAFTDVADGAWYFHARLKNAQGWGAVSHYRFQIDTKSPGSFQLTPAEADESGTSAIIFNVTDTGSGIDYYRITIGDGEALVVPASEVEPGKPFVLPPQVAGVVTVTLEAVDRAGNVTSSSLPIIFTGEITSDQETSVPVAEDSKADLNDLVKSVQVTFISFIIFLILAVFILSSLTLRHLYHHHVVKGKTDSNTSGQHKLRHQLRHLRHALEANLKRLESVRRVKHLSEKSERVIRATSKSLQDLDDRIRSTLNNL
jgi:hypothetical protein